MSALTIQRALNIAKSRGIDRLETQLWLSHVMKSPSDERCLRAWLIIHEAEPLTLEQQTVWEQGLTRLQAGEPLAYLLGKKEFFSLNLMVNSQVLIPRPDTEVLVQWALDTLPLLPSATPRVLDLGTGSGAIAVALKKSAPHIEMHAVDISHSALEVARHNAATLGVSVHFHEGSWWEPIKHLQFDLVVSNPPYIDPLDPHLAALKYEPLQALVSSSKGFNDLEAIIKVSSKLLPSSSCLLLEHGYTQKDDLQECFHQFGFSKIASRQDLAGQWRCTGGWRAS
jgi:release factor glutamine methyltransferase